MVVRHLTHGTDSSDILSYPVAQALCFPGKLIALLDVVHKLQEAGSAIFPTGIGRAAQSDAERRVDATPAHCDHPAPARIRAGRERWCF